MGRVLDYHVSLITAELYTFKPDRVDSHSLDHLGFQTMAIFLEQVAEAVAVNEVEGNRARTDRLVCSLAGEVSRGDEQALVCTSLQGTAEFPGRIGAAAPFPALALEIDLKRNKVHA